MNYRPVIVCACDEKFSFATTVMLKSLLNNSAIDTFYIYILNSDLPYTHKKYIEKNIRYENAILDFVDVNKKDLIGLKTEKNLSITTYYRLLIPDLLPSTLEKSIYLDSDLLVTGNIIDLWNVDLKGKILMAVPEMNRKASYVSSSDGLPSYKYLEIPPHKKYFNAGVLLLDINKWRKMNITEKLFDYLRTYKDLVLWHDQDALNAVLWNEWGELEACWNVMTPYFYDRHISNLSSEEIGLLSERHKILHFIDWPKPWCKDYDFMFADLYKIYSDKIDWGFERIGV